MYFLRHPILRLKKYNRFKKAFSENNIECVCDGSLDHKIEEIGCIKDESEIKKIAKAQEITEKSYLEVLNYLKPGVSERRVALELEHLIKLNGGEGVSFDLITITGKRLHCLTEFRQMILSVREISLLLISAQFLTAITAILRVR